MILLFPPSFVYNLNLIAAFHPKGCMTITGQKCLFPFRYFNDTDPELTYKICSSLDVYRPWCPTKLDDNLNVLEWGDCLEDCPSEPVNSVCLEEPQFPMFSDGSDRSLNFTANYTRGIGVVTDEVVASLLIKTEEDL